MDLTQRTGRVAFQGALGANSHVACTHIVPKMDLLACEDFDRAFNALIKGEGDLAVIPIENSSAGRVADIHRLLPDSGLYIIGEHFLPIHHALVGQTDTVFEDIREALSHEQALSQCRNYLKSNHIQAVKFSDTAAAAKWLAEKGQPHQAAICPALAAEIYGLKILQANISDQASNTTRFLILSRDEETPPMSGPTLTSLLFRTKSEPASLFKALTSFATLGINMTKLESYMIGDRFDVAQFYIDVLAHKDSQAFAIALRDLQYFCGDENVRVMGTYDAHAFRGL